MIRYGTTDLVILGNCWHSVAFSLSLWKVVYWTIFAWEISEVVGSTIQHVGEKTVISHNLPT